MSSTAATAEPTIESVLTGVKGLGTATIAKAFDALDSSGSLEPTPEQLARAADANAGKRDGLKGKALAMWVVTGADSAGQAAIEKQRNATAGSSSTNSKAAPAKAPEFTWPKKPAEILLDYLKSQVTADADAPNKGAPFIDSKGIVRFTGTHWREWLAKQGMHPGKNEAGVPVREAGLKMRPFALPGESRQLGFYTGPAPKGTATLSRRVVERATRSTGGGGGRKPANPFSKFTEPQVEYLRGLIEKSKKGEMKDAMLALLPAKAESSDEPPAAVRNAQAAENVDNGGPSSDTRSDEGHVDAPQEPDSSEAGDASPAGADAPQAAA